MSVYRHRADLSHFGKVIENLNKIREQEELEDCTSTEGVPDEGVSNADVCLLLYNSHHLYQNFSIVVDVNSLIHLCRSP